MSASTKRPRMMSKKPHAEEPSMKGDDRLLETISFPSIQSISPSNDSLDDRQLTLAEVRVDAVLGSPSFQARVKQGESKVQHRLLSRVELLCSQLLPERGVVKGIVHLSEDVHDRLHVQRHFCQVMGQNDEGLRDHGYERVLSSTFIMDKSRSPEMSRDAK
jgi:hypothetical protein